MEGDKEERNGARRKGEGKRRRRRDGKQDGGRGTRNERMDSIMTEKRRKMKRKEEYKTG